MGTVRIATVKIRAARIGTVKGLGFSRAVQNRYGLGLQPLRDCLMMGRAHI